MADASWSNQLHTALEEWSGGRLDRAGRSFARVLESCQAPEMAVWRSFLHNQIALLSQDTGEWEEARLHWQAAQQSWEQAGLSAASPQLKATLDWYVDLLEHHHFSERSSAVRQLQQAGRPPLLDPWQGAPAMTSAAAAGAPRQGASAEESFAPLGGHSVSMQRASASQGSWTELISQALELSGRANFSRALHLFDQARNQVVARRVTHPHLLALVYCAESIGAFTAGNYAQAEKSRDQAGELWRAPEQGQEDLQEFAQALRSGGQETAAVLFMTRVAQNQLPLIDPWKDLHAGVTRGEWQAPQAVDWLARLEEALKQHSRGNLTECQRLLDNLSLQIEADPGREALLGQFQAMISQALGDDTGARTFYNRARTRWQNAHQLGPELKLLRQHGLERVADSLQAGHLLDPFDAPLPLQLGTAVKAPAPRDEAPEPILPPSSSRHLTYVLVAVLLLLGIGAWRLIRSSSPATTPTPSPKIRAAARTR